MTDVSLAGAFLAGLVSFLSPCVLPLVPGYISMLSGIGMEQLRKGDVPTSGLFSSALAFVAGFSVVFISFGASASAVGSFLRQNRALLAPVAGALILLFGLHLIGALIKLNLRAGIIGGVILVALGVAAFLRHAPLFAGLGASHFFSLSLIGFFGPSMARWLNRDVHLRSNATQPGIWSGFLLGFAFAFGWTPCIGPILATVLAWPPPATPSPAASCSSPFTPPASPFLFFSPRWASANSWFSTRIFGNISTPSNFSAALCFCLSGDWSSSTN